MGVVGWSFGLGLGLVLLGFWALCLNLHCAASWRLANHYGAMMYPPSTWMHCPVIYPAAGPAKNRATLAISSGSANLEYRTGTGGLKTHALRSTQRFAFSMSRQMKLSWGCVEHHDWTICGIHCLHYMYTYIDIQDTTVLWLPSKRCFNTTVLCCAVPIF